MEQEGELLEHAVVYGQHKGIPKQQVRDALASGRDVVMRIDVQGADAIRRLVPEAVTIFLTAASEVEQEARLIARGGDSHVQLEKRIRTAREEMEELRKFDYVVVNGTCQLDLAVDKVLSIIEAEHCRVRARRITL